MYKLLLVDDEDDIRGRIQSHLKDIPGFEVVGSAGNGFDALDFLDQHAVDVILSDIKMPFIDGIELTRQVRSMYPSIKVAFITGYDDFDYAKEAINLKIEHYLMKPVAQSELRAFLAELKQEMDEAEAKKQQFAALRKNYNAMQPSLIEKTLISYILYDELGPRDLKRLEAMGVTWMDEATYYGIWVSGPSEKRLDDLYYALKTFIQEELSSPAFQEIMVFPDGLFILCGEDSPEKIHITQMLAQWNLMIERFFEVSVTGFVSRFYPNIQALSSIFHDLSHLKDSIRAREGAQVYFYDDELGTHKTLIFETEDLEILKRLFSSNPEGLEKFIQAQFEQAKLELSHSLAQVKMELYLASLHIFSLSDFDDVSAGEVSVSMYEAANDFNALRDLFTSYLLTWQTRLMKKRPHPASRIQEIIEYVEQNIQLRDLSLDYISQNFYLSVPYISKQFKAKTGVTFSRFVTQKRVDLARDLLKNTSKSISQIALDVGYKDVYYFSHAFKRVVGKSPRDFRL